MLFWLRENLIFILPVVPILMVMFFLKIREWYKGD